MSSGDNSDENIHASLNVVPRCPLITTYTFERNKSHKTEHCHKICWNIKSLNAEDGKRLLQSVKSPEAAQEANREMTEMFNVMMSQINTWNNSKGVFWLTVEIAEIKRNCIAARGRLTRARHRNADQTRVRELAETYKEEKKRLKWQELIDTIEEDVWETHTN